MPLYISSAHVSVRKQSRHATICLLLQVRILFQQSVHLLIQYKFKDMDGCCFITASTPCICYQCAPDSISMHLHMLQHSR